MSENKFTDTLNQLLDQLETVKTEIEKQNARMKQMEASNAELLEALEDLIDECGQAEDCGLIDWKVMGKAREIAHKMRGLQQ
jgi:flagellar motility protein MotE (MotC chaperone)